MGGAHDEATARRRRGKTPLERWDDWIEREIREAMGRGEFADLPGQGKPIRIESNPFDPSMDMAYSRLKNAGYAPVWMELDREVTAGRAELDALLARSGAYLADLRERLDSQEPAPGEPAAARPRSRWLGWGLWRRLWAWLDIAGEDGGGRPAGDAVTVADLVDIRNRMRAQYLERAAALDTRIGDYHAALPPALWHLQRPGMPRERAERQFDARIPHPSP